MQCINNRELSKICAGITGGVEGNKSAAFQCIYSNDTTALLGLQLSQNVSNGSPDKSIIGGTDWSPITINVNGVEIAFLAKPLTSQAEGNKGSVPDPFPGANNPCQGTVVP